MRLPDFCGICQHEYRAFASFDHCFIDADFLQDSGAHARFDIESAAAEKTFVRGDAIDVVECKVSHHGFFWRTQFTAAEHYRNLRIVIYKHCLCVVGDDSDMFVLDIVKHEQCG